MKGIKVMKHNKKAMNNKIDCSSSWLLVGCGRETGVAPTND